MSRAAVPTLEIDVLLDGNGWKAAAQAVVRRAIGGAAAATPSTSGRELAIVLTDDSAIRRLNRKWRGVDAATNVLSFPAHPATGTRRPGQPAADGHLGDIVLAFETIAREARAEHKPFAHHLAHLAVHGFLHLVGYDHERDRDALVMERAERDILRGLGIPDPYRPRPRKPAARAAGGKSARLAAKRPARSSPHR